MMLSTDVGGLSCLGRDSPRASSRSSRVGLPVFSLRNGGSRPESGVYRRDQGKLRTRRRLGHVVTERVPAQVVDSSTLVPTISAGHLSVIR
jgi:hypothetical protein